LATWSASSRVEADGSLQFVRPPAAEERQYERGRLARARLGLPDDVLAREGGRNHRLLDRRGVGVIGVGQCVEHRPIEFQVRERHGRICVRRRHVLVVRIVGRQFIDWNGDVRLGLVELVGFVVWLGQVGGGDGLGF
jgi:hypothetical protein